MVDAEPREDLDGPIAAPDHHHLVFENEHVRVLETIMVEELGDRVKAYEMIQSETERLQRDVDIRRRRVGHSQQCPPYCADTCCQ